MSVEAVQDWALDRFTEDDPLLIEQTRTRLLPRRGVRVGADEILVTVGAQHALYLLAALLIGRDSTVGIEDPGYPDARNIFLLQTEKLWGLPVDDYGLVIEERLAGCDCVYVASLCCGAPPPMISSSSRTTTKARSTMPARRRRP